MKGNTYCMNCCMQIKTIKHWFLDGGVCAKCYFKLVRSELQTNLDRLTEEEIQDLFGSDYYHELCKTVKRMAK